MNSDFAALQAHAQYRKEHGVPNVYTEAEKDALSRKRDRSPPPPTQRMDEADEEEASSEEVIWQQGTETQRRARRQLFASSSGQDDEAEQQEGEAALLALAHAVPDLREYFMQFPNMDTKSIISMCRAYASYLATLAKAPPKKKSRGKK